MLAGSREEAMAFNPKTASLDDLCGWIGNAMTNSINYNIGMAELQRRNTKAQLDASKAQIEAADAETNAAQAAIKSADASERNARYMLWSVVVAAVAAACSAASAAISAYTTIYPSR